MQNIVLEKPYEFTPPYAGSFWPKYLQWTARRRLRRVYGVVSVECQGLDKLQASVSAGHGILVASNHCRPCDPFVIGETARRVGRIIHIMTSSHLFEHSGIQGFMLRRSGAFSVYREGVDRQALAAAITILEEARRILLIFPEGYMTRSNRRLADLMDGTTFIARSAAKKRAQQTPPGQVVIHPVAMIYSFLGDVKAAVEPTLDEIERRLSWRSNRGMPLRERVIKLGLGLLSLKEIEYLGQAQSGNLAERLHRMIERLLSPLEKEWFPDAEPPPSVIARVKKIRMALLPDMIQKKVTEEERARRWRQLEDMYLAQQLYCYPPDYLENDPAPERLLETVERFEEDLTDDTRIYRPIGVTVHIGDAILMPPGRERGEKEDPLSAVLEGQLREMLKQPK